MAQWEQVDEGLWRLDADEDCPFLQEVAAHCIWFAEWGPGQSTFFGHDQPTPEKAMADARAFDASELRGIIKAECVGQMEAGMAGLEFAQEEAWLWVAPLGDGPYPRIAVESQHDADYGFAPSGWRDPIAAHVPTLDEAMGICEAWRAEHPRGEE